MKTAISVPDELFEQADRLARQLNLSRSRIFADALHEYLMRHDPDAVTAALDRVYAEAEPSPDPFLRAVTARTLERADW